jgi:hypothetical protein
VGYAPVGDARAAYETGDTSLVRFVARRTAKTRLLLPLAAHLPGAGPTRPALALATFGAFCAAASASFGRGYRQPSFDDVPGVDVTETDRETGAMVTARLVGRGPGSRLRLAVTVDLPGIAVVEIEEEITGTTVGLHGLGMPAPSRFAIRTMEPLAPWTARATGTITAEFAPRLTGTLVRGHGTLELADDRGTRGAVLLSRDGRVRAGAGGGEAGGAGTGGAGAAAVEISMAR